MLRTLTIRDFVIVDALEMHFERGFTALTGETGAGKSILLDALSCVLGARTDGQFVQTGKPRAEVAAVFALDESPEMVVRLRAADLLDDEPEAVFRRVIEAGGRSRAYINGRPVNASLLRELGAMLVNVHGQHDNLRLMSRDTQREALDAFAAADAALADVAARFRDFVSARDALAQAEAGLADSERQRDELSWNIQQLEALGFDANVWQEEQAEHGRLLHMNDLKNDVESALSAIDDGESKALALIATALNHVDAALVHDESLAGIRQMLASAEANLREAAHDLSRYGDKLEPDPVRLAKLDQRVRDVLGLARKYRTEPGKLGELLAGYHSRLAALPSETGIAELKAALAAARSAYNAAAATLTQARAAATRTLAAQVAAALAPLSMPHARLQVALTPLSEPSIHGAESVEFLWSANPGMAPAPLSKSASGGELSRLGLALQTVLGRATAVPTLIFDEVDTGIGGATASAVGRALARLATSEGAAAQVLCVTHLAPVAACADQQLRVEKRVLGEGAEARTVTDVALVASGARVDEIARMLGGENVTAVTRKAAKELMERAA
jgi:DNA repair protein RecN (Recombination protein N)